MTVIVPVFNAATRQPLAIYRLTAESVSSRRDLGVTSLRLTYRGALDRGRLTRRQRPIVRRNIRFSRALERIASIQAERREGRLGYGHAARALPPALLVKLEHPKQWRDSVRHALGCPTSMWALERPAA